MVSSGIFASFWVYCFFGHVDGFETASHLLEQTGGRVDEDQLDATDLQLVSIANLFCALRLGSIHQNAVLATEVLRRKPVPTALDQAVTP